MLILMAVLAIRLDPLTCCGALLFFLSDILLGVKSMQGLSRGILPTLVLILYYVSLYILSGACRHKAQSYEPAADPALPAE